MEIMDWSEEEMYVTLNGFSMFHGMKPFKIGAIIKLTKDTENTYDQEAIACDMRYFGKIGYVANSVQTVVKGCVSAGRLYDKISDVYFAKIKFVKGTTAIAKVLSFEEYTAETENPESDVHYLCENPSEIDTDLIKKHF